jgi:hypothetical protein
MVHEVSFSDASSTRKWIPCNEENGIGLCTFNSKYFYNNILADMKSS